MDRHLLEKVVCPVCGAKLRLERACFSKVAYTGGALEEVESGEAWCSCGRCYPIEDFVLSFAQLFSPVLQQEADFWEQYYLWLVAQGSEGFYDLSLGTTPFIAQGVAETFPAANHYTAHRWVAEHPLLVRGGALLDVGVGLGWTSLYMARAGYKVTAVEPAFGVARSAKQYAIRQGVFVEYICAALGSLDFLPATFTTVTAFHSIHHVPGLYDALCTLRRWLQPGGILAVDEHVGSSSLASTMYNAMHSWAAKEVLPAYRTISDEAMAGLPQAPHSPLEDSGRDQVLPAIQALFAVRNLSTRHVLFDHYPLLYYLSNERDPAAFYHAQQISLQFQQWLAQADPEGGDYATILAQKTTPEPPPSEAQPAEEPAQSAQLQSTTPETGPTSTLQAQDRARITSLERQLAAQGNWARQLERDNQRKDRELVRLHQAQHSAKLGPLRQALTRLLGRGRRGKHSRSR